MDKAIEDALRWFLTKELNIEMAIVGKKIDLCKQAGLGVSDLSKYEEMQSSQRIHQIMYDHMVGLLDALHENQMEI